MKNHGNRIKATTLGGALIALGLFGTFSAYALNVENNLPLSAQVNGIDVRFAGICWFATVPGGGGTASKQMGADCNHRNSITVALRIHGAVIPYMVSNARMDASGSVIVSCDGSNYKVRLCDAERNCGDDTISSSPPDLPNCGT